MLAILLDMVINVTIGDILFAVGGPPALVRLTVRYADNTEAGPLVGGSLGAGVGAIGAADVRRTVAGAAIGAGAGTRPPGPYALIDNALKAGGGVEKISRFKALTVKAQGKFGFRGEATIDGSFGGPHQVRVAFESKDKEFRGVLVVNGKRAWVKNGQEETADLPREAAQLSKNLLHALCLPDLLMTLKGKDYTLAPLDGELVDGKETWGLRVTHATYKEVSLFFDKSSGLVSKSKVKLGLKGGTEEWCELFFSEYKEINGVQHFTRLRMRKGGEAGGDFTLTQIHLLEKLDAGVFDTPH